MAANTKPQLKPAVACENDKHELDTFAALSRASLDNRLRHPHLGRNMDMARFTTALVSAA